MDTTTDDRGTEPGTESFSNTRLWGDDGSAPARKPTPGRASASRARTQEKITTSASRPCSGTLGLSSLGDRRGAGCHSRSGRSSLWVTTASGCCSRRLVVNAGLERSACERSRHRAQSHYNWAGDPAAAAVNPPGSRPRWQTQRRRPQWPSAHVSACTNGTSMVSCFVDQEERLTDYTRSRHQADYLKMSRSTRSCAL